MAKAKKKTASKTKAKSPVKNKASVKSGARKTLSAPKAELSKKATPSSPILEYKLFCEDSVRSLEDQVNYYIGKGWSPVGGVVLQGSGNYMQTMVRHQ